MPTDPQRGFRTSGVGRHGSTTPDVGVWLTDNCLVVVQTPIHAHEFKHDSKHCQSVFLFITTLMIWCCIWLIAHHDGWCISCSTIFCLLLLSVLFCLSCWMWHFSSPRMRCPIHSTIWHAIKKLTCILLRFKDSEHSFAVEILSSVSRRTSSMEKRSGGVSDDFKYRAVSASD